MKKTIVINLLGGPGAGKSTFATLLFAKLKQNGISCEYVEEFAKGLVWEGRSVALSDQLYILGNQNFNLMKVNGKVNVIITDSPLLLSLYYNRVTDEKTRYDIESFDKMVMDCYSKYDNLLYYLERNFPYVKEGRYQTEKESIKVNSDIKSVLEAKNIKYKTIHSDEKSAQEIVDFIQHLIKVYSDKTKNGTEFERRFILKNNQILSLGFTGKHISQTYLNIGQSEKRVRSIDDKKFFFTEKKGTGMAREEFEQEISKDEYEYLKNNYAKGKTIEKDRYSFNIKGAKKCEVNSFTSPKKLNLVEVEFDSEEQMKNFKAPDWFGEEVSLDRKFNSFEIANEL